MGEAGTAGGTVPVFFAGRNEDDISCADNHLFFFRSHNAFTGGDDENLVAGVV